MLCLLTSPGANAGLASLGTTATASATDSSAITAATLAASNAAVPPVVCPSVSKDAHGDDSVSSNAEDDMWLKAESCKKVFGSSSSGSSSSGSSSGGSDSSSGGGSSGGGGGGGNSKCWHVKAVAQGGGLVGGGGYEGRSGVIEPYLKKEAQKALVDMTKACEATNNTQVAGATNNAVDHLDQQIAAVGLVTNASGIFGRIGEIEMPILLPIMKSFPDPLAPMAKKNDNEQMCGKEKSCCTSDGDKLKKVSQECYDNLLKIQAWYKKKRDEAEGIKTALCTSIAHANIKAGSTKANPCDMATALPLAQTTIEPVNTGAILADWNDSTKFTATSTTNSLVAASSEATYVPSSSSGNAAKNLADVNANNAYTGDPTQYSGAKVDMSNYTPVNADGTFGDDKPLASSDPAFGNSTVRPLADFAGSFQQGENRFSGSLSGYGIQNDQVAKEMDPSSVSKPNTQVPADRLHITNSLTIARERLITKETPNKQKKVELVLQELNMFERSSRGYYGADGKRALFLAQQEQKRNQLAGEALASSNKQAASNKNIKPVSAAIQTKPLNTRQ